ncbi:6036_t:CDS:1, partial [Dentiscutata erythropus]
YTFSTPYMEQHDGPSATNSFDITDSDITKLVERYRKSYKQQINPTID